MGGIVMGVGGKVSSALQMFGSQKSARDYYRTLASDADYQAAYAADATRRQGTYLFKSAAERSRDVYAAYRQTAAAQKSALAAAGLTSNSATVQSILKNTRLNSLLDERTIQDNLRDALYENEVSAAEKIRGLNITAGQYRRMAKNSFNAWTLGDGLLAWLRK